MIAIDFDGTSNARVSIPPDIKLDLTAITISAWIKFRTLPSTFTTILFHFLGGTPGAGYTVYVRNTTNELNFEVRTDGVEFGQGALSNTALSPNVWYHFVGWYDHAQQTKGIMINGIDEVVSSNTDGNILPVNNQTWIGNTSSGSGPWDGYIDDVKIFNKALTAPQRLDLYNGINVTDGLVANWAFNEGIGTITGESINNLNGTLESGASWAIIVRRFIGREARGLSTDPKPNTDHLLYLETDTGRVQFKGVQEDPYTLIEGFDKVEVLRNKTIDLNKNNIIGDIHTPFFANNFSRTGGIIPSAMVMHSVHAALSPLRALNSAEPSAEPAHVQILDSVEGAVCVFEGRNEDFAGYDSSAAPNDLTDTVVTRMEWNPVFKIRCKLDSTAFCRLYIGYNALATGDIQVGDTPLANNDQGVIVGFATNTPLFSVFHNSGSGPMTITPITDNISRDSAMRNYEIALSSTNAVVKIDDAHTTIITTNLPAATTDLRLFAMIQVTE